MSDSCIQSLCVLHIILCCSLETPFLCSSSCCYIKHTSCLLSSWRGLCMEDPVAYCCFKIYSVCSLSRRGGHTWFRVGSQELSGWWCVGTSWCPWLWVIGCQKYQNSGMCLSAWLRLSHSISYVCKNITPVKIFNCARRKILCARRI